MKDAYSFDINEDDLNNSYNKMKEAYLRMFNEMDLEILPISANAGEIGGSGSEEFISPSNFGEDRFVLRGQVPFKIEEDKDLMPEEKARTGIEVAHIFKLGDKYSRPMGLKFKDREGKDKYAVMGCYGIGVSRLITALIEQHHDNRGIIWPASVSPFDVTLISTSSKSEIREIADKLYQELQNGRVDVLYDDRDVATGVKFGDADLVGIPKRLIIGQKSILEGIVELEFRDSGEKKKIRLEEVVAYALLDKLYKP